MCLTRGNVVVGVNIIMELSSEDADSYVERALK